MNKREGLWILKFGGLANANDLGERLRRWKPLINGDIAKLRGGKETPAVDQITDNSRIVALEVGVTTMKDKELNLLRVFRSEFLPNESVELTGVSVKGNVSLASRGMFVIEGNVGLNIKLDTSPGFEELKRTRISEEERSIRSSDGLTTLVTEVRWCRGRTGTTFGWSSNGERLMRDMQCIGNLGPVWYSGQCINTGRDNG